MDVMQISGINPSSRIKIKVLRQIPLKSIEVDPQRTFSANLEHAQEMIYYLRIM
jgi:hypothetical protein